MADVTKNMWVVFGAKPDGLLKGISDVNRAMGEAERDWKKNIGNIANEMKSVGIAIGGFGAAITATLGLAIKETVSLGSEMSDLADKTGMSVESLTAWKYAAEQSGAALTDVETAVKMMANTLSDAQAGSKTAQKALSDLGLTVQDILKLSPDRRFEEVAKALSGIDDPAKKSALAMDIFGRSGTNLLPMLKEGSGGFVDLTEKAKTLGLTMSTDSAVRLDEFGDTLDTIKNQFMMTVAQGVMPLIDALRPMIDTISSVIGKVSGWMAEHQELSKILVIGAGVVGVVSTAIGGLLLVGGQILTMIPAIVTAWKALSTIFSAAGGPIGIAIAAITALIAVGITLWQNWDTVTNALADAWDYVKIGVGEAVQFICDKLIIFLSPALILVEKALGGLITVVGNLVGIFNEDWGNSIKAVGETVSNLTDKLSELAGGMADDARASIANRDEKQKQEQAAKSVASATNQEKTSIDGLVPSLGKASTESKTLADEQDKLAGKVSSAIDKFKYQNTEAGKLGLTIDDVIVTMHNFGFSNEQIVAALDTTAGKTGDVDGLMRQLGLTAEDVAEGTKTVFQKMEEQSKILAAALEADMKRGMEQMQAFIAMENEIQKTINGLIAAGWTKDPNGSGFLAPSQQELNAKNTSVANAIASGKNLAEIGSTYGGIYNKNGDFIALPTLEGLAALGITGSAIDPYLKANYGPGTAWYDNFTANLAGAPMAANSGVLPEGTYDFAGGISGRDSATGIEVQGGTAYDYSGLPFYSYASGGIAWRPQMASIAENGPELITPLDKLPGGGITINMHDFSVRNDDDIDRIADAMVKKIHLMGVR